MIRSSRRFTVALSAAAVAVSSAAVASAVATPAPQRADVVPQATRVTAASTVILADTFEDGSTGEWTVKASQKLTLSVVSGGASTTPGNALKVAGVRKVKVGPKRVFPTSGLVKGQWYRATAWVRVPGASAPSMVTFVPQQSFATSVTYPNRSTGDWAAAGTAFVWPGKGKLSFTVRLSTACPGDVIPSGFLLDDVTLTALDGAPPVPSQIACTSPTPTTSTPSTTTSTPKTSTPDPTTSTPSTITSTPTPTYTGPTTPPSSYPNPGYVTGDVAAHDPTVVKRPDGTYLMATTGTGIPLKTSKDRTRWTDIGAAFPGGASWAYEYTPGPLWAPDLTYADGLYWMYYSASTFGSSKSAIYLATSTTGEPGTWTNRGLVVASTASSGWNAIDPELIIGVGGRWWLAFGSFWSGLKVVQVGPGSGLRVDTTMTSIAQRSSTYDGAIEAADVIAHNGYYYLFASFDACCKGASSTYRIMVGRSGSITGPFYDRNGTAMMNGGGTQVLAGHGSIHGPGHSSVIHDVDGDVIFYHWYDDSGAARMGINLIGWDSQGWPFVY